MGFAQIKTIKLKKCWDPSHATSSETCVLSISLLYIAFFQVIAT